MAYNRIKKQTLKFRAADVRRVVEHALAAKTHRPEIVGYTDCGNPKYAKSEPAVILVHDEGIYLMSNGTPRDIVEGERSFVAYAEGCDPREGDVWHHCRSLVGGDDFAEQLPWAKHMLDMIDDGDKFIRIHVTDRGIRLMTG